MTERSGDEAPSAADRYRRRIRELRERLEQTEDSIEREALESDIAHLEEGVEAMEKAERRGRQCEH